MKHQYNGIHATTKISLMIIKYMGEINAYGIVLSWKRGI